MNYIKTSKSDEEYIQDAELELENANYHREIRLPGKLYHAINDFIDLREEESLELARIISEEFIKNI